MPRGTDPCSAARTSLGTPFFTVWLGLIGQQAAAAHAEPSTLRIKPWPCGSSRRARPCATAQRRPRAVRQPTGVHQDVDGDAQVALEQAQDRGARGAGFGPGCRDFASVQTGSSVACGSALS